jgi:hypothetical protein
MPDPDAGEVAGALGMGVSTATDPDDDSGSVARHPDRMVSAMTAAITASLDRNRLLTIPRA